MRWKLFRMKIGATVCAWLGHSRIVSMCFGYVHCGRCEAQIGDTLAGFYNTAGSVVIGHACDTCRENMKEMTWRDRLMVGDPFKKSRA